MNCRGVVQGAISLRVRRPDVKAYRPKQFSGTKAVPAASKCKSKKSNNKVR